MIIFMDPNSDVTGRNRQYCCVYNTDDWRSGHGEAYSISPIPTSLDKDITALLLRMSSDESGGEKRREDG